MPPVVLLHSLEETGHRPPVRKGILEDEPRRESVPVQTPVRHDRVALGRQRRRPGRLPFLHQDLGEVDGDQHHLLMEVPGPELVPELPVDVLGFRKLAEAMGDLSFDPVQAKLLCGPPVSSVSGGFCRLSFLFPPPVTEVSLPLRFEVSWLSFRFWRLAVVQDLVVLASFYPC